MSQAHVPSIKPHRRGQGGWWAWGGLLLAVLWAGAATLPGCSDKEHLLSPKEAQDYKKQLILDHPGALTRAQIERFNYYMGRTQADIDRVFEQLLREQEAAAARDRKAWEDSRKKEDPTILPLLPGAKDAKGGNP